MQKTDEIVVLRKSELRSVVSQAVKSEVDAKFDEIKGFMENLALKKDLPPWVRETKAAELLGISSRALAARRKKRLF